MTSWTLVAAAAGFATAVVVTRIAERWSRGRGLVDVPNERSSHVVPTPRIGGLGIVAGTVVAAAMAGALSFPVPVAILLAGCALAAVGLVDDLRRTSVLAKYSAQLAAGAVAAILIDPVIDVRLAGAHWEIDGVAAIVVTVFWLTALTNAFNFMDGIDGLVAGVGVVVAVLGLGLVGGPGALLLVGVAAACAGFLVWNHAPASVFMGDIGSQFLGFTLGASLLMGAGRVDAVPMLLLLGVFLFDTGFTLVRRAKAHKNLMAAHREHLYQRIVVAGRTHREVAAGHVVATVMTGSVALAWRSIPGTGQVITLAALVATAVLYAAWVGREEAAAVSGAARSNDL